jgi:hypothetical protein
MLSESGSVRIERRVFVSVSSDRTLDDRRRRVKQAIIARLVAQGLSPQIFFESGLPQPLSWSFDHVISVMRRCVGAIVIGFPRWQMTLPEGERVRLVGEFAHFEGAVALVLGLPTLIAAEEGVQDRAIVYRGAGKAILPIPQNVQADAVFTGEFGRAFETWAAEVQTRQDIFLGYCSRSIGIAAQVQLYAQRAGATVQNWAMDFRAGPSILEELERARNACSRAIFVFSEDDPLDGESGQVAPRDNVVFEAGLFIGSKGARNCMIVRIGQAKMPADLGGVIYASLARGEDVAHIETSIRQFVTASIQ